MEPELELKLCSSMADETLVPSPANTRRRQALEMMVRLLEEELPKIEAIKHHLPYSASIVAEAFEILKKKLEQSANENHMATEELLPIKIKLIQAMAKREDKRDNSKEKVNLSLCLGGHNYDEGSSKNTITTNKFIAQESKEYKSAFVPYKSPAAVTVPTEMTPVTMHDLSTAVTVPTEMTPVTMHDLSTSYPGIKMGAPISSSGAQWSLEPQELHSQRAQWGLQTQELQCQRKARRCWSEDIHNKFVLALERLGGPIEATPRKIREVMNVDGLTNDEVKSHLQKYRMRARNESSSSAHGSQPLVSGSYGAPQDHYPPYSPQGPLQLVGPTPTVSLTGGDSFEVDGNSESYSSKRRK